MLSKRASSVFLKGSREGCCACRPERKGRKGHQNRRSRLELSIHNLWNWSVPFCRIICQVGICLNLNRYHLLNLELSQSAFVSAQSVALWLKRHLRRHVIIRWTYALMNASPCLSGQSRTCSAYCCWIYLSFDYDSSLLFHYCVITTNYYFYLMNYYHYYQFHLNSTFCVVCSWAAL